MVEINGECDKNRLNCDQDLASLNEIDLKRLLEEAMSYKTPKDAQDKSQLFKELLKENSDNRQEANLNKRRSRNISDIGNDNGTITCVKSKEQFLEGNGLQLSGFAPKIPAENTKEFIESFSIDENGNSVKGKGKRVKSKTLDKTTLSQHIKGHRGDTEDIDALLNFIGMDLDQAGKKKSNGSKNNPKNDKRANTLRKPKKNNKKNDNSEEEPIENCIKEDCIPNKEKVVASTSKEVKTEPVEDVSESEFCTVTKKKKKSTFFNRNKPPFKPIEKGVLPIKVEPKKIECNRKDCKKAPVMAKVVSDLESEGKRDGNEIEKPNQTVLGWMKKMNSKIPNKVISLPEQADHMQIVNYVASEWQQVMDDLSSGNRKVKYYTPEPDPRLL